MGGLVYVLFHDAQCPLRCRCDADADADVDVTMYPPRVCVFYSHSLASFCDICVAKSFDWFFIELAMLSGVCLGVNDVLLWGVDDLCCWGSECGLGGCARRNGIGVAFRKRPFGIRPK